MAAAGLAAVLTANPGLFTLIRWLGAGFLAWLGIRALAGARTAGDGAGDRSASLPGSGAFQTGLINMLHPGQVVFYTSVLPQFIDPARDMASQAVVLGAVFVGIVLVWFATYAALLSRLPIWGLVGTARQLSRLTGIALLGLAASLVLRR